MCGRIFFLRPVNGKYCSATAPLVPILSYILRWNLRPSFWSAFLKSIKVAQKEVVFVVWVEFFTDFCNHNEIDEYCYDEFQNRLEYNEQTYSVRKLFQVVLLSEISEQIGVWQDGCAWLPPPKCSTTSNNLWRLRKIHNVEDWFNSTIMYGRTFGLKISTFLPFCNYTLL